MSIAIRSGEASDARVLAELAARTFRETFAADNRPEDLALHMARSYGAAQQERELLDPAVATLLAEVDGQLAGYAQLRAGTAPACVTGEAPVELWRFYVAEAWHGMGVAQALMRAVEAEALRRGGRTLWLGVWERNQRAKAFYGKTGFTDVGSHMFMVGTDSQTDRIMARPVPAMSADAVTGLERQPPGGSGMERRGHLFWRALAAFLFLPGVFAFVVPWLLRPAQTAARPAGLALLGLGLVLLLWCLRDFHVAGKGTLAPWAPPQQLVVVGLYRVTRNPMYVAVLLILIGWASAFESPRLWLYALGMAIAFQLRVLFGEEPWLAERYGEQWSHYRATVPRWLFFPGSIGPRRTPRSGG